MKIYQVSQLPSEEVKLEGANKTKMRILVGPKDGSENIIMRHFIVEPGGNTPYHQHDYEHVVKIIKGKGLMIDKDNNEHEVTTENCAFVPANEMHQFKNHTNENFEFLCIIPNKQ